MTFLIVSLITTAMAAQLEVFPGDDLISRTAALQPGDELILNDGLYQIQGTLSWSVLGTETEPVIIRAADGAQPVVEMTPGQKGTFSSLIVDIQKSQWITISGIVFQGSVGWDGDGETFGGIRIYNSENITITNSEIAQTPGTLLNLSGTNSNITVERTRMHDTINGYGVYVGCYDASCWTAESTFVNNWIHSLGGEYTYAMWLSHGSQGIDVIDNVIYGSEYRGVYLGSTEYGEQNIFEGNAVWDVSNVGLFIHGSARVRNNIIFNVDGTGLYIDDPDRETYSDVVVSFNTIALTTGWGAQLLDWYDAPGMVFANNVVSNPVGYGVYYPDPGGLDDTATPMTENVLSNNVISGLVDSFERISVPEAVIPGGGNQDFQDVEGWNFYPADSTSSLVGMADPAGDTYIPTIDFNGLERTGDALTVGAYEWKGGGNPGWYLQEGFKEFVTEDEPIEETVGGGCCANNEESSSAALVLVPMLGFGVAFRRRQRPD